MSLSVTNLATCHATPFASEKNPADCTTSIPLQAIPKPTRKSPALFPAKRTPPLLPSHLFGIVPLPCNNEEQKENHLTSSGLFEQTPKPKRNENPRKPLEGKHFVSKTQTDCFHLKKTDSWKTHSIKSIKPCFLKGSQTVFPFSTSLNPTFFKPLRFARPYSLPLNPASSRDRSAHFQQKGIFPSRLHVVLILPSTKTTTRIQTTRRTLLIDASHRTPKQTALALQRESTFFRLLL